MLGVQVVLGSNPNGPVYVTSETIPLSLVWSRIPEHFGGEPGDQTLDRAQAIVSSNLTGPIKHHSYNGYFCPAQDDFNNTSTSVMNRNSGTDWAHFDETWLSSANTGWCLRFGTWGVVTGETEGIWFIGSPFAKRKSISSHKIRCCGGKE